MIHKLRSFAKTKIKAGQKIGDRMKVSVVIPAYNEETLIGGTLIKYAEFLKSNFDEFELIAVNDGSTDKTLDEIKRCRCAKVVSYSQNRGKGYAVKRGILRATGDYIFFTDADGSYEPVNITRAISVIEKNRSAGVIGVRENRCQAYSRIRRFLSKGLSGVLKAFLTVDTADSQCGFKGFERKTAKQLFAMTRIFDFGFDFEVIYLSKILGKPLEVLPVTFVHRSDSRVRLLSDMLKILWDIFKIRKGKAF